MGRKRNRVIPQNYNGRQLLAVKIAMLLMGTHRNTVI